MCFHGGYEMETLDADEKVSVKQQIKESIKLAKVNVREALRSGKTAATYWKAEVKTLQKTVAGLERDLAKAK